ncbi:MAG: helix-turn-helix domain-containing protein [Methylibium petroleiphilum]|uniref:helix-turn-helix domain-containing protein n=1 Tax=Methylibium petroleiphilum TaxID=105560 RepID=UPI003D26850F
MHPLGVPAAPRSATKPRSTPKRATSFEPEIARAFGTAIRAEREKREIAQDQFALLAHVDRSYYGKLERGERQPSLALMLRIARALGFTGAELLTKVEKTLAKAKA